jgi:catechol 2,3-dioxygenase-like lactoylglutathione lyase family enzyme
MKPSLFDAQITFVYVGDLARSASFYGDVLGTRTERTRNDEGGQCLSLVAVGDQPTLKSEARLPSEFWERC